MKQMLLQFRNKDINAINGNDLQFLQGRSARQQTQRQCLPIWRNEICIEVYATGTETWTMLL